MNKKIKLFNKDIPILFIVLPLFVLVFSGVLVIVFLKSNPTQKTEQATVTQQNIENQQITVSYPVLSNVVVENPVSFTTNKLETANSIDLQLNINPVLGKYSAIKIQDYGCQNDNGFYGVSFENAAIAPLYVVRKSDISKDVFDAYYMKFVNKTFKGAFILYPHCGGAAYVKVENDYDQKYNLGTGFTLLTVGPYQYVPAATEDVELTVGYFQYNESTLIQTDFVVIAFKYSDVENYQSCLYQNTDPVSYGSYPRYQHQEMDLSCFGKLLSLDQTKMDLIEDRITFFIKDLKIL